MHSQCTVPPGSPALAHHTARSSEEAGEMEQVSPRLQCVCDKRQRLGVLGRRVDSLPFTSLVFHLTKLYGAKNGLFLSTFTCTFSKTACCALGASVSQPRQEVLRPCGRAGFAFSPRNIQGSSPKRKDGQICHVTHARRLDCSLCALQRAAASAWNAFQPSLPNFCFKVTSSRDPALKSPGGRAGAHLYCCTSQLQPQGGSTGLCLRAQAA